jgi:release factor glutamine methyltransferase
LRILDICTGSGCIALALAKHLPKDSAYITGLDISNKAIELANLNLNTHRSLLRNSVEFHQKDVFELQLQQYLPAYNVIVSNPPYITNQEYKLLDQDVKNWEDPRALVAEEEGTRVHKRIVEVSKYCHPLWNDRPYLFMEIGGTHQIEALSEYMLKHGFKTVDIWKDLADKDRVITGGI